MALVAMSVVEQRYRALVLALDGASVSQVAVEVGDRDRVFSRASVSLPRFRSPAPARMSAPGPCPRLSTLRCVDPTA